MKLWSHQITDKTCNFDKFIENENPQRYIQAKLITKSKQKY
jgi:hypothetical protein